MKNFSVKFHIVILLLLLTYACALRVFLFSEKRNRRNSQHQTVIQGMRKVAELDVGNNSSEKNLNYQIIKPSWSGSRNFPYPNNASCNDNGRAYRGKETLTLENLIPNKPIVILKRLDPTVKNQVVDVNFNGKFISKWALDNGGVPGHWHESTFKIPREFVTGPEGTFSFVFVESTCDINSFCYWFFQPQ